jgi:hypothetical protein
MHLLAAAAAAAASGRPTATRAEALQTWWQERISFLQPSKQQCCYLLITIIWLQ